MNTVIKSFWHTKWILAVTAGVLLGLSYPPLPLPFLIFPGFLIIFRLIDLSHSAREAAFWSWLAFLIWNLITTYWLMMATLPAGIAAIVANSAVMTLPVMLQYHIQKQQWPSFYIVLLQASCWLSYEYFHHQWDLAWPWLTLANAWANVPDLVQYISVTGYWGISLWILLTASLAYQAIQKNNKTIALAAASVLLLFPGWSLIKTIIEVPTVPEETQEVVVVQPDFDSYHSYGGYPSSWQATQHLLKLTDSVRTPDTQLILWPENSIQNRISNLDSFGSRNKDTQRLLHQKASAWGATIITGAVYYEFYDEDQAPLLPYKSPDGPFLPFNAALGFTAQKTQPDIYRKHNLVPIVERIPFVHFLNAIDLFDWINWSQNQQYGKGSEADAFPVEGTQIPALICYDSVFPNWVRQFVQQGSGFLTVITNDGWWGNTSGHEQHFAYARLRAVEFDRWVVRSANNGISGVIDPEGEVQVRTTYKTSTAFRYEVPILTSLTFYARFGDWLPQVLLLCLAAGSVHFLVSKRTWKKSS